MSAFSLNQYVNFPLLSCAQPYPIKYYQNQLNHVQQDLFSRGKQETEESSKGSENTYKQELLIWIKKQNINELVINSKIITNFIIRMYLHDTLVERSNYALNEKTNKYPSIQDEFNQVCLVRKRRNHEEENLHLEHKLLQSICIIDQDELYDTFCIRGSLEEIINLLIECSNGLAFSSQPKVFYDNVTKQYTVQNAIWFNPNTYQTCAGWIINECEKAVALRYYKHSQQGYMADNISINEINQYWEGNSDGLKQKIVNQISQICKEFKNAPKKKKPPTVEDILWAQYLYSKSNTIKINEEEIYRQFRENSLTSIYYLSLPNVLNIQSLCEKRILRIIKDSFKDKILKEMQQVEMKEKQKCNAIKKNKKKQKKIKKKQEDATPSTSSHKDNNESKVLNIQELIEQLKKLNRKPKEFNENFKFENTTPPNSPWNQTETHSIHSQHNTQDITTYPYVQSHNEYEQDHQEDVNLEEKEEEWFKVQFQRKGKKGQRKYSSQNDLTERPKKHRYNKKNKQNKRDQQILDQNAIASLSSQENESSEKQLQSQQLIDEESTLYENSQQEQQQILFQQQQQKEQQEKEKEQKEKEQKISKETKNQTSQQEDKQQQLQDKKTNKSSTLTNKNNISEDDLSMDSNNKIDLLNQSNQLQINSDRELIQKPQPQQSKQQSHSAKKITNNKPLKKQNSQQTNSTQIQQFQSEMNFLKDLSLDQKQQFNQDEQKNKQFIEQQPIDQAVLEQAFNMMIKKLDLDMRELNDQILQQNEAILPIRQLIYNRLQFITNHLFRDCNSSIRLFGSCATGLALNQSDIDFGITGFELYSITQLQAQMKTLIEFLKQMSWVTSIKPIYSSTMPLLKLKVDPFMPFQEGISSCKLPDINIKRVDVDTEQSIFSVDISFFQYKSSTTSPHLGQISTEMTLQWLALYQELRPLTLLFKTLLKKRGLNDQYKGGISSFCVIQMVIAFLEDYYQQNKVTSIGHTTYKFLEFYGTMFDPKKLGICYKGFDQCPFYELYDFEESMEISIVSPITNEIISQGSSFVQTILSDLHTLYEATQNEIQFFYEKLKFNKKKKGKKEERNLFQKELNKLQPLFSSTVYN